MRYLSLIAAALVTAACTSPAEHIADTLVGYGIDRARADCVGERLQRDLSTGQMRELARAASAYRDRDADPSRLSLDDLLRATSEIRDPRIPVTLARAAGQCGLVPAPFASPPRPVAALQDRVAA